MFDSKPVSKDIVNVGELKFTVIFSLDNCGEKSSR
jgi:hypothetical protein